MIGMGILQPAVALMGWTMVMWAWMYATRIPALRAARIDADSLVRDPEMKLDKVLPPAVQWKAHNYNHLHEAPTLFYAVALLLSVVGQGDGLNAWLGWAYFTARMAHSLIHATVNRVMARFAIFVLSSLILLALIVHAAIAVF